MCHIGRLSALLVVLLHRFGMLSASRFTVLLKRLGRPYIFSPSLGPSGDLAQRIFSIAFSEDGDMPPYLRQGIEPMLSLFQRRWSGSCSCDHRTG